MNVVVVHHNKKDIKNWRYKMISYTEATCITNLDDYQKKRWPRNFIQLPRIGEFIKSHSGKTLKVKNIIHCGNFREYHHAYIIIELNK